MNVFSSLALTVNAPSPLLQGEFTPVFERRLTAKHWQSRGTMVHETSALGSCGDFPHSYEWDVGGPKGAFLPPMGLVCC